ncbi:major tail protein [Paenibacillus sp. FSL H7-0357]|uniref:major tail protein n=1 Tax=Paenibacillus sp. FSL H7-0357 TaxID=1536774 RepID=UPI000690FFA3|nr:major tail protein [Paenibacillus sp. FSL H7-0357]
MEKKYGEFVGVDNLHFAKVTDTTDSYTAEAPKYLAPAAEISAEAETSNTPTYYDNVPGNNYVSEGVTTLTITVSGIPAYLAAELLGKDFDPATGRLIDSGQPNPPDVAVGYRANIGREDYRYTWYLKGTFSGGAEEAATKTADVDIRTYQLTFTAVATTKQFDVMGEDKPIKKVSGDTTHEAFDPTGWFAQVQTPDNSGAPAALTFTSVPANNATSVAVGANMVLTFANKLSSYSAVLLNGSFDVIASAITLDSTGKVLTINPNANLAAATEYAVIINGAKDVYGQTLPQTVISFTTA